MKVKAFIFSACRSQSVALALALFLSGCATAPKQSNAERQFEFQKDTFAYPNELLWEYLYDANGKWTTRNREPHPTYAQHCFVVARSALQFFRHARFDPEKPVASEAVYRKLISRVVASDPRRTSPSGGRIVIP